MPCSLGIIAFLVFFLCIIDVRAFLSPVRVSLARSAFNSNTGLYARPVRKGQDKVDKSLNRHSLLTPQDENELALQYKLNFQLRTQYDVLEKSHNGTYAIDTLCTAVGISKEKLFMLVRRGEMARNLLFRANSRLVFHLSKFYRGRGISYSDLIQEARRGLVRAIERFDPDKGFRLSTYASWWIKQAISDITRDNNVLIKVPRAVTDLLLRIKETQRETLELHGRILTYEELSRHLGVPLPKIMQAINTKGRVVGVEDAVYKNKAKSGASAQKKTLKDIIPSSLVSPEDDFEGFDDDTADRVATDFLETIPKKEAQILRMRFGFDGDPPKTLEEIGTTFGITRERVRQLESNALLHLRVAKSNNMPLQDIED